MTQHHHQGKGVKSPGNDSVITRQVQGSVGVRRESLVQQEDCLPGYILVDIEGGG